MENAFFSDMGFDLEYSVDLVINPHQSVGSNILRLFPLQRPRNISCRLVAWLGPILARDGSLQSPRL